MSSLAEILRSNPNLELLASNKILCKVTQHELPPRSDAVLAHINGKKYKKALEWYSYNFDEFLPYIVPHKSDRKKLYCKLTDQTLNKIPDQVKKHCMGKKFQRLKEEQEKAEKGDSTLSNNDTDLDIQHPPYAEDELPASLGKRSRANKSVIGSVRESVLDVVEDNSDDEEDGDEDDDVQDSMSDLMGDEEDYVMVEDRGESDEDSCEGIGEDSDEDRDDENDEVNVADAQPVGKERARKPTTKSSNATRASRAEQKPAGKTSNPKSTVNKVTKTAPKAKKEGVPKSGKKVKR